MSDRLIDIARDIAIKKKLITDPEQLQISTRNNKRFMVLTNSGEVIHFGIWPYLGKGTFIDHKDDKIRTAWKARHSKIKLKSGQLAYESPYSPEYWSWHILW